MLNNHSNPRDMRVLPYSGIYNCFDKFCVTHAHKSFTLFTISTRTCNKYIPLSFGRATFKLVVYCVCYCYAWMCVLLLRVLSHGNTECCMYIYVYRWGRLEVEARFIEMSISVGRWKAVIFSPLHNGFTFRMYIYVGFTPRIFRNQRKPMSEQGCYNLNA